MFDPKSMFEGAGAFQSNAPSDATKRVLNAKVADVSPALYAAGARTNLTREERNLIENWTEIKSTHEKLMSMDNKKADEAFNKLHPDYQAELQKYYGIDYANKPSDNLLVEDPVKRKLLGLDNGLSVGDIFKSPFRFLFAGVEQYSKALNTPIMMAENAVINRESFWTRSNGEAAFDGDFNYDHSVADALTKKYGVAVSFAAQHLLAGKTPGEIIDAWGPNDATILDAVNKVFNEPEEMSKIMDEFDRARLSPGRNVARWINKTFGIDAEEHPDWFKFGSGTIDGTFQIFADPLTYLTGGLSVVGKAGKLAKALQGSRNVVEHFARPEVAKYFTGYADEIGKYADAVAKEDFIEAGKIKEGIRTNYKEHGTDKEVELWASSGVKDFETFKAQFTDENPQNFQHLIQGKVVGTAFSREGAAFARPTRELAIGSKQKVKELFTGKVNWDELDKVSAEKLLDDMYQAGLDRTGNFDYTQIDETIRTTAGKGLRKFIERQTSLHPGRKTVFVDDDKVLETLETVRNQAYFALEDKRLAHMFTEHFKTASEQQRIALKKTIDELTMRRSGIHGMNGGREYMNTVLGFHYGERGSFSGTARLRNPAAWNRGTEEKEVLGPILPYQMKDGIAPLDWRSIAEFAAHNSKKDKSLTVENVSNIIGGAFNNKVVSNLTDTWSLLTLIPQLGIRTSVDESFFFGLTANLPVLKEFWRAKKVGNVFTAYTGSDAATGPLKNILQVAAGKLTGKQFGAVRGISQETRDLVFENAYKGIDEGFYASAYEAEQAARMELFDIALNKYGKKLPLEYSEMLKDAARYNPNILSHVSSSNITDALLSRQGIRGVNAKLMPKSSLDKSLEEYNMVSTGNHKSFDPRDLTDAHLHLMMFDNFTTAFGSKGFRFGGTIDEKADPARLFIANNSLRTEQDFVNATNQFLEGIGFEFNGKIWQVNNKKVGDVQKFLNSTTHMSKYDGLSDVEKATKFIEDTYADLYSRFHGGPDQFNEELNKVFRSFQLGYVTDHRSIIRQLKLGEEVLYPSGTVKFKSYKDLVKNNLPDDNIFSDLELHLGSDFSSWTRKYRDKAFEAMSRQADDIYRQPALHAHYIVYRKETKVEEALYAKKLEEEMIRDGVEESTAKKNAKDIASRFYTDRAMTRASNQLLKYADNPEIQTIFATNVRTVGRFYRAVEDFHRRMYRLVKDNKLNTIYRLRLMNQGLDAVGAVHEDENGEQFVILPMDDIIYSAVDGTVRMLTGNDVQVNQPLFNDITFKVTAANPSFQTDAGVPYLSGPAGALSVLAVKSLLGKFDPTKNLAEDVDQIALGSMGDNVTFRSAVAPKFVNNIWKMLSPDERSQQEVSAYTQALSYYQANGLGVDPADYTKPDGTADEAAFDEAKRKYLADVKIGAHNIIVTRALLGMILPFSVQSKDTKDLPTYLKENGVVSLKSSFYDVLDEVKFKYPDVEDPYELALATWMGKNPSKTVYLVSTNQEGIKPMIKFSSEMQDWAIRNKGELDKYGSGALMFAPYIGEFSPGVYQWAEAAGIVSRVPEGSSVQGYISKYFDSIALKQYANAYYDINDKEQEDLRGVALANTDLRRSAMGEYEKQRKIMKMSIPGLSTYLDSGIDNADAEDFIQSAHSYVNSPTAEVTADVKAKINEAHQIYSDFMDKVNMISMLDVAEASELKRAEKEKAKSKLLALVNSDSTKVLEQYYQYGLLKMMNSKTRDSGVTLTRNIPSKAGN